MDESRGPRVYARVSSSRMTGSMSSRRSVAAYNAVHLGEVALGNAVVFPQLCAELYTLEHLVGGFVVA
jgi:hypothetical protein